MTPTPRTDAVARSLRTEDVGWAACSMMEKHAQGLERELVEANTELLEQARLLGISGSREAKLLAELVELDHCRQEAERAEMLAKEVEALKVDAERYRWLRSSKKAFPSVYLYEGADDTGWFPAWGGEIDDAIDAARGEK